MTVYHLAQLGCGEDVWKGRRVKGGESEVVNGGLLFDYSNLITLIAVQIFVNKALDDLYRKDRGKRQRQSGEESGNQKVIFWVQILNALGYPCVQSCGRFNLSCDCESFQYPLLVLFTTYLENTVVVFRHGECDDICRN